MSEEIGGIERKVVDLSGMHLDVEVGYFSSFYLFYDVFGYS